MAVWEAVRHQVAIAGRVTDGRTGQTLARARVEINASPAAFTDRLALIARQYGERWASLTERPDRTHAAADGHFHFLDLSAGQYTLIASLPGAGQRYGQAQKVVTVLPPNNTGKLVMVAADITLSPTTVKGQITRQGTSETVVMAEVRVQGSGERTFSNGQGQYLLTGLEASAERPRTLLVSAQGYQPAAQTVLLSQAGTEQTLNFNLVLATP